MPLDLLTLILVCVWLVSDMCLTLHMNRRMKTIERKQALIGMALELQKDINDLSVKQFSEIAEEISNIQLTKKGKK